MSEQGCGVFRFDGPRFLVILAEAVEGTSGEDLEIALRPR